MGRQAVAVRRRPSGRTRSVPTPRALVLRPPLLAVYAVLFSACSYLKPCYREPSSTEKRVMQLIKHSKADMGGGVDYEESAHYFKVSLLQHEPNAPFIPNPTRVTSQKRT